MSPSPQSIRLWIAAAGSPTHGYGGWAYVAVWPGGSRGVAGGERRTGVERMGAAALAAALDAVSDTPAAHLTILTSSAYGLGEAVAGLAGWRANGWQAAAETPAEHRDLWAKIAAAIHKRSGPVQFLPLRPSRDPRDALAFVQAWANLAQDKVRGAPAFTAPIPKSNLLKFPGAAP